MAPCFFTHDAPIWKSVHRFPWLRSGYIGTLIGVMRQLIRPGDSEAPAFPTTLSHMCAFGRMYGSAGLMSRGNGSASIFWTEGDDVRL